MRVFVAGLLGASFSSCGRGRAHGAADRRDGHEIGDRRRSRDRGPARQPAGRGRVHGARAGAGEDVRRGRGKAYSEKAKDNPNAFIVYQPVGRDGMDMGPQLAIQAATDILSALLVAWVLSLGRSASARAWPRRRAGPVFLADGERALWNWYRFTTDFTSAACSSRCWAGCWPALAIAWWLGRGNR
jgi:hypothetical protein